MFIKATLKPNSNPMSFLTRSKPKTLLLVLSIAVLFLYMLNKTGFGGKDPNTTRQGKDSKFNDITYGILWGSEKLSGRQSRDRRYKTFSQLNPVSIKPSCFSNMTNLKIERKTLKAYTTFSFCFSSRFRIFGKQT